MFISTVRAVFAGLALAAAFATTPAAAERATAILVLEHVRSDGSVWDFGPGADPVLCLKAGCYRSHGDATAAEFFPAHSALKFGNAGDCSNAFSCIFRHIDVDAVLTEIAPIDVDVIRHDGMEKRFVSPDRSCAFSKGELQCAGGTYTSEYSLWMVPDAIADAAGPEALRAAAETSIARARTTAATHFLASELNGLPDAARGFYQLVLAKQISEPCQHDPSVMLATFALSGLVKRGDLPMLQLLNRYLDITDPRDMRSFIASDPRGFWRLHDAIDKMHLFASAESVERINFNAGGIALETNGGASMLRVDPELEARAQAVIDRCQDGQPVGEGFIGDPLPKTKLAPLTPEEVSKHIAKSLPRIDPNAAPQRIKATPKPGAVRQVVQHKATVDFDAATIRSILGLDKISLK